MVFNDLATMLQRNATMTNYQNGSLTMNRMKCHKSNDLVSILLKKSTDLVLKSIFGCLNS